MVRRNLERRKKPKIALPRRTFRRVGELHDEPEVEGKALTSGELGRTLNYYNYLDLKDPKTVHREWVVEYVKSGPFSDAEVKIVKAMEDWRIKLVASVSRLLTRGAILEPEVVEGHVKRVRAEIASFLRNKEEAPTPVQKKPPSDRRLIAEFEEMYDAFLVGGCVDRFSAYDFLSRVQATRAEAAAVASFYQAHADEVTTAFKGKDKDLKEAYSNYPKKRLNSCMEQLTSIVADATRYSLNKKATVVRKPRKKKEKSAAEQVKRVTYMKEDKALQIVSVDPATIIGSKTLWLYNVKYKSLRRLVAGPEGFSVRGSTIFGFTDESEQRSLRKPADVIKSVLSGTPHSLKLVMGKLTTKPSTPNGRVNPDTIILRATGQ